MATDDVQLAALAVHYRLLTANALLEAEAPVATLLEPAGLALLRRKLERRGGPRTDGAGVREIARELGYVVGAMGPEAALDATPGIEGDYEYLLACHALGRIDLCQMVDVLEEAGLPLWLCYGCRMGYYPRRTDPVPALPTCPDCDQPLEALTRVIPLGLVGAPAPALRALRARSLEAPGERGTLGHALLVALRYHLLAPRRATLLGHPKDGSTEDVLGDLSARGWLSAREVAFLRRRVRETLEAGRGTTGGSPDADPLALAVELGHLDETSRAWVESHHLVERLVAQADRSPEHDVAVIQLAYNLGQLRFYQALDLLERKGLRLDHCSRCHIQWHGGSATGRCPRCAEPVVRMTGWDGSDELAEPIPAPRPLRVQFVPSATSGAPANAVGLPPTPGHVLGAEEGSPSSAARVPSSATSPGEPSAVSDELVKKWVRRYRLLDDVRLAEAGQLVPIVGGTLLQVLKRFGYLDGVAVRFLGRRAGDPARMDPGGLLGQAVSLGYLARGFVPADLVGSSEPTIGLRLLASAYNAGHLAFYQLVDLLEIEGVRLEHCPRCGVQFAFPRPVPDAETCPRCRRLLLPLHRPGAQFGSHGIVPVIQRLRIEPYPAADPGAAASTTSIGSVAARDRPIVGARTADQTVERLLLRFGWASPEELERFRRASTGPGAPTAIEEHLLASGVLSPHRHAFLTRRRARSLAPAAPPSPHSLPISQLAVERGYLSMRQYHRVFQRAGAPDPREEDPLPVARFLYANGALELFELVDVLEELGVTLLDCPACEKYVHVRGTLNPGAQLACPRCYGRLVPLTTPPGALPDDRPLRQPVQIETIAAEAGELLNAFVDTDSSGSLPIESGDFAPPPPLVHLALEPVEPGTSWVDRERRLRRLGIATPTSLRRLAANDAPHTRPSSVTAATLASPAAPWATGCLYAVLAFAATCAALLAVSRGC